MTRISALDLLRSAMADDAPPGALERATAALSARFDADQLRIGDYHWIGDTCLQCCAIVRGSHRDREVARYSEIAGVSLCPDCGSVVSWESAPEYRDDPRCDACRCPPTLRDPGLSPPDPGMSDATGGGATVDQREESR